MNSKRAKAILEQAYPEAAISEVRGNPNVMGWLLFNVAGRNIYVDTEGNIFGQEPKEVE